MNPRPKGARWKTRIIALDGEGWGTDADGRQLYRLMVAADNHGNRWSISESVPDAGLRTIEIFDWLMSLPADGHFTSFVFGYDIAHILIDLPLDKLTELYHREDRPDNASGWGKRPVRWDRYWFDWVPKKQFILRIPLRNITIWDAYPFYQSSFLNACKKSKLFTAEELTPIEKGKERRGDDVEHEMGSEIAYALAEMEALAKLQYHLFETFESAGVNLKQFYGPGSAAVVYLKRFDVGASRNVPKIVNEYAEAAYIGGRFEQTGHGYQSRLYEYDINSAYPFGASNLPCFAHGKWAFTKTGTETPYAMVHIQWFTDPELSGYWGPFPVRKLKTNMPHWPFEGEAWLWRWEYEAGQKIPGVIVHEIEWAIWEPSCNHRPFDFVTHLYNERQELKALGDGREKVNKLVLNSMYGKLAQTVGTAPYYSPAWAGGITSHCRAQLLSAITGNPHAVVAVATDAVMSTEPLDLDIGPGLGQWSEPIELYDCLLVQPGFYNSRSTNSGEFPQGKSRTRGIPRKYIEWDKFWNLFRDMSTNAPHTDGSMWKVTFNVDYHIGIGLTVAYQDKTKLGRWTSSPCDVSFFSLKRPEQEWDSQNWIASYPVSGRNHKPIRYKPGMWYAELFEDKAREIDQDFPWLLDE